MSTPRGTYFWVRVLILILALIGVFYSMGYFDSGRFSGNPQVQEFLNPVEPERRARVITELPAETAPTATPTKDR